MNLQMKCFGPFAHFHCKQSPAGTDKFQYIVDSFLREGNSLEIISYIISDGIKSQKINDRLEVKYFRTKHYANRIFRMFASLFFLTRIFFELLFRTPKNSIVLVYHDSILSFPIFLARQFKKFKLILEVEEIYADVFASKMMRWREYRIFNSADAFLLPTELLNAKINPQNKPFAIVHGSYQTTPQLVEKFSKLDKKIHAVYAGIFEPRKGSHIAAAAAEYLPENYHIHILGYGKEEQKRQLLNVIKETSKKTKCSVTYDGLLRGDDFTRFIQACDIGFSTQAPDAEYNSTSFPSKVLMYLTNGLRVVSIRIPSLEASNVHDLLFFYDENNPQTIAQTVCNIDLTKKYDSRFSINELNEQFGHQLKIMLEEVDKL